MARAWHRLGLVLLMTVAWGCGPKKTPVPPAPPPPAALQPKQTVVVLLPDPDGKSSTVTVTNAGGTQRLSDPYQAVRLQDSSSAPAAPFAMDREEVRRVFGEVLDTLPAAEAVFVLYFAGDSDVLNAESMAKIPDVLTAIRERRSTSISIIGHTDTTATPRYNYRLGLRRGRCREDPAKRRCGEGQDFGRIPRRSRSGGTDAAGKTGAAQPQG